jgi:hypothetical protein
MLAFKNLQLLSVKTLALDRHTIVFEGDTTICLKHRDAVFEAYINQGLYIVEDSRVLFTNKGEDDPLNKTFWLDESNAEL